MSIPVGFAAESRYPTEMIEALNQYVRRRTRPRNDGCIIEVFKTGEPTMNKSPRLLPFMLVALCALSAEFVFADDLKPIQLPPPQTEIGKPLMQALKQRQSSRSFDSKPLPPQELSNLLWAADGINRADSGKRTAPSAMNWQEVDVYVALPDALYLYEPKTHTLVPVVGKDLREATGKQDFVKDAPLNSRGSLAGRGRWPTRPRC